MQRESMQFDVVIVGAGPAGLSAAIRLAQLNQQNNQQLSICIIEKAASIGAHTLSGAVLNPKALDELLPDWQQRHAPITTSVTEDQFAFLTKHKTWILPKLKAMSNKGNYIISLANFCKWLAEQAEQLGVSIFPGFAASKILFDDNERVIGIQTGDMGLNKHGEATDRLQPGINLYATQTLFAEGCRGSLTEQLMDIYNLRNDCDPQSYGIGVKELWKIPSEKHRLGTVIHTIGWPLSYDTYGGSFIYHFENNLISLGLVIGLDYKNPYLDPFQELQKLKTHPMLKKLLANGECIGYGSRALNEGGWQSIPRLTFPGGMLIGCAAGFLNVAKIKGIHTAMKSGMLAAENIMASAQKDDELTQYSVALRRSWVNKELYQARNIRPGFHKGLWLGLINAGIDQYILRGKAPWTFHYQPDYKSLELAKNSKKISYPKADGKLTFTKLDQVFLTATKHREDEPCHLKLKDPNLAVSVNFAQYAGPEQYYCPAGVYEYIEQDGAYRLQINAPNCIHCKTCDIKDPRQNIVWTVPEGGDGPNYSQM